MNIFLFFLLENGHITNRCKNELEGGLDRVKYDLIFDTNSDNYRKFDKQLCKKGELRVPSSWQKYNTEVGLHPTQKPVALFEYLIKTYTNENELILDNCAGSGTTGISCINTNRDYILIEKEKKYYDIILDRIETHKNKK